MTSIPVSTRVARLLGFPYVSHLPQQHQHVLKRFWKEGVYSAMSFALSESFFTLYALSLNASNAQIGLVNTLSQVFSASLSIPGAIMADRTGRYKTVALLGMTLKRLTWLVMALLPWFLPDSAAVWGVVVAWVGFAAFSTLAGAAWSALMADIVPDRIRGQVFAVRNILDRLARLMLVPLAGLVIKWIGEPLGYQLVLIIAFVLGVVSLYHFQCLPEHAASPVGEGRFGLREVFRGLHDQPNYVRFMISHAVLNFGVMLGGPFVQVYMVQEAGFDVATISVVTSVGVFTAMIGMRILGRLEDQRGITWIMRFAVAMPVAPILWLGVQTPFAAYLVQIYAALAWTGYTLGSFNLLLAITPDDHRPHYVALHTTVAAVAGALGPLIGGWLLDVVGFMPVFSLSTIIRSLGLILFLALVREPAHPEHLARSNA